jgi:hypothetical protein
MLSLLNEQYFDRVGGLVTEELKRGLETKNLTGFGSSNASGKLLNSIRYEATNTGVRVYAFDYIYYLEKGRKPGKRPPFDPSSTKWGVKVRGENKGKPRGDYPNISEWIESVNRGDARERFGWSGASESGKANIVSMIARAIGDNGTIIYQNGGSDLISAVITDNMIQRIAFDIMSDVRLKLKNINKII